jgi:hypothetical protein
MLDVKKTSSDTAVTTDEFKPAFNISNFDEFDALAAEDINNPANGWTKKATADKLNVKMTVWGRKHQAKG